jgi:hypothetical protein
MQAGDVMAVPVDSRAVMLIPPLSKRPETVTPQEFLNTPAALLENRIIIARGLSQPEPALDAMAAAITCILNSRALRSSQIIDILAALILAGLIALNFRSGKWQVMTIALLLIMSLWGVSVWLSTLGIVTNPVTQTFAVLFALFSVIFFRSALRSSDRHKRYATLIKHMDHNTAKRMIKKNTDIMLANSEKKAWLMNVMCHPAETKKTFEKVLKCLYNGKNDYLAVVNGDGSITVSLFENDSTVPKTAVNAALCIKEAGFPVLLRRETVFVSCQGGAYMVSGGTREMLAGFMKLAAADDAALNVRVNVFVPGRDIQDYIGITKFQKANASAEDFFAVTGQREDVK